MIIDSCIGCVNRFQLVIYFFVSLSSNDLFSKMKANGSFARLVHIQNFLEKKVSLLSGSYFLVTPSTAEKLKDSLG